MNIRVKWIPALVFSAGFGAAAAGAFSGISTRAAAESPAIRLPQVVVTPAKAMPVTIGLAAVVVTPNLAEWRSAALHAQVELAALGKHLPRAGSP